MQICDPFWHNESEVAESRTEIWASEVGIGSKNAKRLFSIFSILDISRFRDWSLITGRGGLQNGKIAGPKLFAPPPQDRVKLFAPPPFKEWKLFVPPLQYG